MACTCAPGKALCRSCLNQTSIPYVGSTVNGNGEYTLHQINVFQKQFETTIAADVQQNPLTEAVNRYGVDFYSSLNQVNELLKRNYIADMIEDYPVLAERLKRGPISALEYAAFIKDSSYTPSSAIVSGNANGSRFLNELDGFYNGDFSTSVLGGFCSLFGNIFAAINGFFDLVESVQGLIDDAITFINKIKNIEDEVKAFFEKLKVKALIEAIKEKIVKMIEKVIKKVEDAINNFSVENIIKKIDNFVQKEIVAKITKIKEDIKQFFSKENIEKIKNKIKNLINYAVSQFENPSVEEIMFMIARFCAFATGLEGLIKGLKGPLDDFSNRYEEVLNTISNASSRITGEAIRSGAVRLSEEARREKINTAKVQWEKAGNIRPSSVDEYRDLPSWDALEAGSDSRLKIQGGWVTKMSKPREGWEVMDIDFRVLIMRLQKEAKNAGIINGHLYLNSGYRDTAYNTAVDGAKSSQHLSGLAADLTWDGFRAGSEDANNFVALARRQGFRGIGLYNSFIHVDVGPERQWDKRG